MAGGHVTWSERAQLGLLLGADLLGERAAGAEAAARRRVQRRWELAAHRDLAALLARDLGIRHRNRLDREQRLVAALASGKRTADDLLDAAWADVPALLRPAAAVTLAAHLDKLSDEGRVPDGVERPTLALG